MTVESRPVPTHALQLGMYVAKLDRPWLETPFLFQGFHIETEAVIDELRRHCKFVYIDAERSDPTLVADHSQRAQPMRPPRAGNSSSKVSVPANRPAAPPDPDVQNDSDRDDTALLKAELPHARSTHDRAERLIQDLFRTVRAGEPLAVGALQETLNPMIESIMRNEDAMSWLTRMKRKDDYVYDHSVASSVWAMIFGKHLGLDKHELQVLAMGAIMMDVGKTKVPTELLVKRETLNSEEMALMRQHVAFGVAIVSEIKGIDPRVIDMVRCHHERYNGTGYPRGLSGSNIPIFARIAGIIDAFDAMTTPRAYAEPMSTYDAMRQLNNLAGVEFPAEVVEQFVQAVGVFPVGTLVELNTGEVGVVIAQNRVRRLRPKILLLLDQHKKALDTLPIIDLRNQLADARGENSIWIDRGLAPGTYGLEPSEYYL
jgi:HD-GYP domain-containing protein (c-di-GMP phosphodiesterase class II)